MPVPYLWSLVGLYTGIGLIWANHVRCMFLSDVDRDEAYVGDPIMSDTLLIVLTCGPTWPLTLPLLWLSRGSLAIPHPDNNEQRPT